MECTRPRPPRVLNQRPGIDHASARSLAAAQSIKHQGPSWILFWRSHPGRFSKHQVARPCVSSLSCRPSKFETSSLGRSFRFCVPTMAPSSRSGHRVSKRHTPHNHTNISKSTRSKAQLEAAVKEASLGSAVGQKKVVGGALKRKRDLDESDTEVDSPRVAAATTKKVQSIDLGGSR